MTQLLRRGDPSLVETDLVDLLVSGEEEWLKDDRDLMMALAPHHDCARRLGADVAALFRRAAAAGPASLRELVEEFGRRKDVTPQAFGFFVEETPEGLRYRSDAPPAEDLIETRTAGQPAQPTRDTGRAMSQENVELRSLAEAAFGALNSRDLDGFMAVAAEDVEFTSMIAEVEGTTFQGHDGIRTWWETVVGAFGEVHWEVLDVRGAGDRGVAHIRMDGTLGEVPLNLRMWLAARLREGRVTRWSWYRTEREAREAIGLRE